MHITKLFRRYTAPLSALLLWTTPTAIKTAPPQLRIIPQTDLRFGSFAIIDRGYRVVDPAGGVQNVGIFSIASGDTGPALFRIRYDRGNNGRRRLDLRFQMVLSQAPVITQGGITAQLSQYQTDIPGYANVQAGEVIDISIPNCRTRICRTSFNVGGRLDVASNYGGGTIRVPIPADIVLISVR